MAQSKRRHSLPATRTRQAAVLVHPPRRATFDLPHRRGDGQRRRQRQKEVDVVTHAADGECLRVMFACNSAHVSPQSRLNLRGDDPATLLGREDTVIQRRAIGVGHDGRESYGKRGSRIAPPGRLGPIARFVPGLRFAAPWATFNPSLREGKKPPKDRLKFGNFRPPDSSTSWLRNLALCGRGGSICRS